MFGIPIVYARGNRLHKVPDPRKEPEDCYVWAYWFQHCEYHMFDYHFCRWVFRCWKGELGYQSTPCEFI